MSEQEVKAIAEQFLASQDMRGYTAVYVETKTSELRPKEWVVVFDMITPHGTVLDGPTVVLIDKVTKKPRLFDSL